MDTISLPLDFKEFLQLLDSERVEYLVVGGYAVMVHGFPRGTGDLDVWIRLSDQNAAAMVRVLERFGFSKGSVSSDLFLEESRVVRMGFPPLRIEILTRISGVSFEECYPQRYVQEIDGVSINFISGDHLRQNKRASGRAKDLNDLENLP